LKNWKVQNLISFSTRISNYHFTYLLGFVCALTLSLLHFYKGGSIILGGEGNYILDYSTHLEITFHQWLSRFGLGEANMASGGNVANILFLTFVESFFGDAIANFVLIFSMYFFPFAGMYLVAFELGAKPYLCALIALFYTINPFTTEFLISINQWNNFALSLMPILFWVVLRYYHDNLKLFLFYGSTSALFSFAYTNYPLNAIINISTIFAVYIVSLYRNERFLFFEFIKKYSLVFSAFLIFNCWWLLNIFMAVGSALSRYSADFAGTWLIDTVSNVGNPLAKSLSLTHMSTPSVYSFVGYYFHTPIAFCIGIIPIFLVVAGIFFSKPTKLHRLLIHILILTLAAIFLLKGASPPFGSIYLFLFKYIPFFTIFKSPIEKFGILYTFLLSILLLFMFLAGKNFKYYKKGIIFFTVYLFFCMGPLLTGNMIPELFLGTTAGTATRKFTEQPQYKKLRGHINQEKLVYKILSLPGMGNYQVLIDSLDGKKYVGMDPLLMNTNKGFLASQFDTEVMALYDFMLDEKIHNLFGVFNIGKLVINGNLQPWYGLIGPAGAKELRDRFKDLPRKNFGNISVHSLSQGFVPMIYTPRQIMVVSKQQAEKL